jgi:hypothetical protein
MKCHGVFWTADLDLAGESCVSKFVPSRRVLQGLREGKSSQWLADNLALNISHVIINMVVAVVVICCAGSSSL